MNKDKRFYLPSKATKDCNHVYHTPVQY